MDLDRGALARIDRKLLAGLGDDETFQMGRVPVTPANWLTWRRYRGAAGISMGRAIAVLIERELVGVFGESTGNDVPLSAGRVEERLASREAQVDAREREVKAEAERLQRQNERLRLWEGEIETGDQRIELVSKLASRPPTAEA